MSKEIEAQNKQAAKSSIDTVTVDVRVVGAKEVQQIIEIARDRLTTIRSVSGKLGQMTQQRDKWRKIANYNGEVAHAAKQQVKALEFQVAAKQAAYEDLREDCTTRKEWIAFQDSQMSKTKKELRAANKRAGKWRFTAISLAVILVSLVAGYFWGQL